MLTFSHCYIVHISPKFVALPWLPSHVVPPRLPVAAISAGDWGTNAIDVLKEGVGCGEGMFPSPLGRSLEKGAQPPLQKII